MDTLIIYYSHTGHTAKLAEAKARELNAALLEVKNAKKPNGLKVFFSGCPAAMGKKSWPLAPLEKDISGYERYIVMGPIWAGYASPQVNAIVEKLPAGSRVEFIMVSGSGKSSDKAAAKAEQHAKEHGLEFAGYTDVQG